MIDNTITPHDIFTAIAAINPSARVSIKDEDVDQITWHDTPVISKSDIEAKMAELKVDHDSKQYQRDRKLEYGTWEEQLDMMHHGTWKAHVQTIRDKYPK